MFNSSFPQTELQYTCTFELYAMKAAIQHKWYMMNMLDTNCKSGYIEHQNGYSKSEKIVVIQNLGGKSFKYK